MKSDENSASAWARSPPPTAKTRAIRLLDSSIGLMKAPENPGVPSQEPRYHDEPAHAAERADPRHRAGQGGQDDHIYSCLRLNDGTRKINTIEDPIEYVLEGVRQSQINRNRRLQFPAPDQRPPASRPT